MAPEFVRIYMYMRLLNLLIVFNLTLCMTGIYSATDLFADESASLTSHCHDHEQSEFDGSLQDGSIDLAINSSTHVECYNCCLDVLPSSNDGDNFNVAQSVITLLPSLSFKNDSSKIQILKSVFTKQPHSPPDLYLLHSSYLL